MARDRTDTMGGGHIETGLACRGERICRYDRLLEIEDGLGGDARFGWPGRA